uniref:interferon-inducible GTPase 5-like n=1 Tax=Pristiophorus japonicus TaxID=55135 RepID=UPI00398F8457
MAGVLSHMFHSSTDVKHLADTYRHGGQRALQSEIERKTREFENVKLQVAVMGESGKGKSSFINALRDLGVNDEGVAPTGVEETTKERTPYQHPTLPNVTYWDFPGIGTPGFPAKAFLKKTDFSQYDFGIIVSADRFTENDAALAKRMKKAGKPFYFVRSKIDMAIKEESKKRGYNQEEMFQRIRECCTNSLTKVGIQNPRVFLLSNNDIEKYDFPELNRALDRDLPETKKNVFLLSLPNTSLDVIKRKQELLKHSINVLAAISGGIGVVPIPGVSLACDLALIVSALLTMRRILGLDNASIRKVAEKVGKDEAYLRANTQHPWVYGDISTDQVIMLLQRSAIAIALTVAEPILDFVPIIGSIFGAASSFWVTYTVLNSSLDELVQAAHTVMQNAYN